MNTKNPESASLTGFTDVDDITSTSVSKIGKNGIIPNSIRQLMTRTEEVTQKSKESQRFSRELSGTLARHARGMQYYLESLKQGNTTSGISEHVRAKFILCLDTVSRVKYVGGLVNLVRERIDDITNINPMDELGGGGLIDLGEKIANFQSQIQEEYNITVRVRDELGSVLEHIQTQVQTLENQKTLETTDREQLEKLQQQKAIIKAQYQSIEGSIDGYVASIKIAKQEWPEHLNHLCLAVISYQAAVGGENISASINNMREMINDGLQVSGIQTIKILETVQKMLDTPSISSETMEELKRQTTQIEQIRAEINRHQLSKQKDGQDLTNLLEKSQED